MEMHQVRYFLAMARTLNFTRSAEECNVTQPSLTRAIQKLEDELGGPLFRRERSRTHLTDLGRLMLPHLERTYEAAQAAKDLARGVGKAQVAPLALGVASLASSDTLDAILAELGAGLAGFELSITGGTSRDLLEAALAGSLDLAIIEVPEDTPDRLETWPLFAHRYRMLTHTDHPLARAPSVRLADLGDEPWIDCAGDDCAALAALGLEPRIRHRACDPAAIRRMILAGLGSAFVPESIAGDGVQPITLEGCEITREVALVAVGGRRRSLAADAFVRAARARSWASSGVGTAQAA